MLTKHPQNESNLPCQNALKPTYGSVKIKKISGVITLDPSYRGGVGNGRRARESRGRQRGNLPERGAFRGTGGDLVRGFSDLEMTWLLYFAGAATVPEDIAL